ncbi:hypothetical protein [Gimesia maris]|uniref:hypothetical protein n=1 Tax=Gimesia maris TaxID=122 RepID=UPI0030D8A05C|tara:strand:+ start:44019 stop:44402 length:384 start_codon:yes stop_codon:yes gene_type:complete
MPQTVSEHTQYQIITEDIKLIAFRQKVILVCILIYLSAVAGQSMIPVGISLILGIPVGIVIIVAAVFIFLLATKLYGAVVGIFLGILTLIPLVGLFVLLIVNGKATKMLKENGVDVGLLGARGPISL